ncbi:hypothetical protein QFZ81_002499 [Paenibacillus sp. V4I9]|nr:hypothetical protein [Paenibacillus sp. V4I9]
MWNLYEIEKRFEQHIREIEKRSRRAHWYEKKERRGFHFLPIAGMLSALALVVIGYFLVSNALS